MASLYAAQRYYKTVGETRNVAVDFTSLLATTETISSSTTLQVTDATSALTFGTITATTIGMTINGTTVSTGQAVSFTVAGGSSGIWHVMNVRVPTSLSQILLRGCKLKVVGNPTS